MIRAALLALVALVLTGCATTTPPPPIRVEVPIATPCLSAEAARLGQAHTYADTPDALRAAADLADRVRLLLAGRSQRDADLAEVRAAIRGCLAQR